MQSLSDIKKIAVLGAGTMGPGIAQTFATGGYRVTICDLSSQALEKAGDTLGASLETFAREGALDAGEIPGILNRVSYTQSLEDAVGDADFVMETIVENKEAKSKLYMQLVGLVPPEAIVASNTSALNVFEIMPEELLPQAVIAHWYAPPQLIPLVEVIKSQQAPQSCRDITMELLERCGKTPVTMNKFIQGYIVNRLQMCLNQEVFYLLDNGYCTPEDIDKAAKASFIPRAVVLGICKRADFSGLDMTANNYRNKSYTMPPQVDMPKTLQEHLDKGELGLKTGKGFYDYAGSDPQALLAKRDKQLFEIFQLAKRFMQDPV